MLKEEDQRQHGDDAFCHRHCHPDPGQSGECRKQPRYGDDEQESPQDGHDERLSRTVRGA